MKNLYLLFLILFAVSPWKHSFGSESCRLIKTSGFINEYGQCEILVSENSYEKIFVMELLEDHEFNFNGVDYLLSIDESPLEKWIPVIDDLKVLAKDTSNNKEKINKIVQCIAGTAILANKALIPCASCLSGSAVSEGALAPLCTSACGVSLAGVGVSIDKCL